MEAPPAPPPSDANTEISLHDNDSSHGLLPIPAQEYRAPTCLPLNPSDNLYAYTSSARLPPLPYGLSEQLKRHMDKLLASTATPDVQTSALEVRANRTRLTAKPKEGDRVLAEIERIDLNNDFYPGVRAHAKQHIPSKAPDYPALLEMYPEMFGQAEDNASDDECEPPFQVNSLSSRTGKFPSTLSRHPGSQQENLPPPGVPEMTLPFNLPADGFALKGVIPEYCPENDDGAWKATRTRVIVPPGDNFAQLGPRPRKESSMRRAGQARNLLSYGRLQRMGSGLAGMPSELNESLDDSLNSSKAQRPSNSTASLSRTSSSSSTSSSNCSSLSRASSISSADDISILSHIIKSSLLPTAASVVQLTMPFRARGWEWWTPDSDASSDDQSTTGSSIFAYDSAMRGWDAKIWGSDKGEDSFLLAIQPPWHMPNQTFTDFTQSQEFTDGVRGERGFLTYEKLWATLFDVCSARNIRYFAVTSYEQIAFGCFGPGYRRGFITPPISTLPSPHRRDASPNFLQCLVYWMLSSMETPDGWLIHEPVIVTTMDVDYRSHQLDPLVNDSELQRVPTPPPVSKSLKRFRVEKTTGEVEVVPFDWGMANQHTSASKRPSPRKAKRSFTSFAPQEELIDANDELEIERYLDDEMAMDVDVVLNNGLHRRLGNHLIRMESLSSIDNDSPASATSEDDGIDVWDDDDDDFHLRRQASSSTQARDRSSSGTFAPVSVFTASSSKTKASSNGRLIRGLPKGPTSRKVSSRSNDTQVHFNKIDVVRGGEGEGGWVKGRRQRPDGRWEVNLDGVDGEELFGIEGEGVVAVGSPVLDETRRRRPKRRETLGGGEAPLLRTSSSEDPLPVARRSGRHSAPGPPPALDDDDNQDIQDAPRKKRAKMVLVESSDQRVRTRSQSKKIEGAAAGLRSSKK